MPDGKSISVNGQLSVVYRLAGINLPLVTKKEPLPYIVDKDLGKFYYLVNR
jgi:hypothetical protein